MRSWLVRRRSPLVMGHVIDLLQRSLQQRLTDDNLDVASACVDALVALYRLLRDDDGQAGEEARSLLRMKIESLSITMLQYKRQLLAREVRALIALSPVDCLSRLGIFREEALHRAVHQSRLPV